jgi:hypothetical protein
MHKILYGLDMFPCIVIYLCSKLELHVIFNMCTFCNLLETSKKFARLYSYPYFNFHLLS